MKKSLIGGRAVELHGRTKIYTTASRITEENVISELNDALKIHAQNAAEEDYLYWYRRGVQPVLHRHKTVRPEINSKVVQNLADEIVAFKNGYFLTQPTFYVSRREDEDMADEVNELNEYLYLSGKHEADNDITDSFHTMGLGVAYVAATGDAESPAAVYAVDPRHCFVVYSTAPGNEPVFGVNYVITDAGSGTLRVYYDVYTSDMIFRISGSAIKTRNISLPKLSSAAKTVESVEINAIGYVPIIEYEYNRNRMSAFENVISLLDTINDVQSNRMDGIKQFIESLMVFYNCQLGDDEEGNPITPAYIREAGAIFLKSVGQDKADLKILAEQLDQTQTQVLMDDLVKQVYGIAGVPITSNTNRSTSDNAGAVYLRSGWATADTFARNTEDLFKRSNKYFDRIFLKILQYSTDLEVKASDIDIQFTRNEMDNLLVKTQGAINLKALGLSPELVLAKSGVSNDPAGDVAKSKKYIDIAFSLPDPNKVQGDKGTVDGGNAKMAEGEPGDKQGGSWVQGYWR